MFIQETATKQNGWTVVAEFSETVPGTTPPLDRPECSRAVAQGLPLVAKLDRLSRDVEHIASLMRRVDFKVGTMPQADKFQLHLFAALAEQESEFAGLRSPC
jgi:DNA invertase Pin-like site-specific DNA recombinase